MDDLRHSFPPISFTPEEKEHLAARLRAAAEQEETMNNIKRHGESPSERGWPPPSPPGLWPPP